MNRLLRLLKQHLSTRNSSRRHNSIRLDSAIESLESRMLLSAFTLADAPNVEFGITESWGSAHTAELVLNNDEGVSYSNWQLEFDYEGTITSIWNGEVQNLGGNRYRVTPPNWDQTLDAGESLAIGFSASGPGVQPSNLSFRADGMTAPTDAGGDSGDGGVGGTIVTDDASASIFAVDFSPISDWGGGFTGDIAISNEGASAVNGWTLEFDFAGEIVNIWNAEIVDRDGEHYVITNASWNATIAAGQTIHFGFQGSPGNVSTAALSNFHVNGQPVDGENPPAPPIPSVSISDTSVAEGDTGTTSAIFDVTLSSIASQNVTLDWAIVGDSADDSDVALASGSTTIEAGQLSRQIEVAVFGDQDVEADETFRVVLSNIVGATIADGTGTGTILNDDVSPPVTPTISISDAGVIEGDVLANPATAAGFFSTDGNQIVDSEGNTVKITAVSWFGFESETNSPHGLWTRNYRDMMDDIVAAGFNTIRLPFNNEMFDAGKLAGSIDAQANPELVGLTPIEVLDRIVEYAGEIGLRIVLDHHRSDNGIGALNDGLWYTANYPDERFLADWVMLAERYQGNPTVIGADLHNEPHGPATWGSGDLSTDWKLAAERAGNAILAVNPDWLIIVEGIETYEGQSYWWGGNLKGVQDDPVQLDISNRLVYSPHAYPNSIYAQPWFSDPTFPDNLPEIWRENWGYIYEQDIAPLWIGEFGSNLQDPKDIAWMDTFVAYLGGDLDLDGTNDVPAGDQAISWSFWSWNPNSGDTGGILLDDWRTFNQQKLDLLSPIQSGLLTSSEAPGAGSETTPSPETSFVEFSVSLSEPTSVPVSVDFSTTGLTATAGVDFVPAAGTLQFEPGETSKLIRLQVIGDLDVEPDETFQVTLSAASGGVIADGAAIGTIINDDVQAESLVSISDATVTEPDAGDDTVSATFLVTLNQPSDAPVSVSYATADGTAVAGEDYEAASGQISFAAGETSKTITIRILGDAQAESNQQFFVTLSDPVGAVLAAATGTGIIVDNDAPAPATDVDFAVVEDWNAGFQGAIDIRNESTTPWDEWTLQFTFAGEITDIWNAVLVSHIGDTYVVRNAPWNGSVPAGGGASFGFIGTPGGVDEPISDIVLEGSPL